ncbi:MAG: hypothetical protein RSD88_06095 [Anaerovoracaceae bacterium]
MRINELLTYNVELGKEKTIGREVEAEGRKFFILGIRQVEEDGELFNRLMVLQEDEDILEDEEDWEEEQEVEGVTNRQILIDAFVSGDDSQDLGEVIVGGISCGMELANGWGMEEMSFDAVTLLKHFGSQVDLPLYWRGKELEDLGITEYDVDEMAYGLDWNGSLKGVMENPMEEVLVGKVIECQIGQYDVPQVVSVPDKEGRVIKLEIRGVSVIELMEDTLIEEDQTIPGKRLLILDYIADEDVQVEIYKKDYLDLPFDENEELPLAFDLSITREDGACNSLVLDVVSEGFEGPVDIEWLSYCILA